MDYIKWSKEWEEKVKWLDGVHQRSNLPANAQPPIHKLFVLLDEQKGPIEEGNVKEVCRLELIIEIKMIDLLNILFDTD